MKHLFSLSCCLALCSILHLPLSAQGISEEVADTSTLTLEDAPTGGQTYFPSIGEAEPRQATHERYSMYRKRARGGMTAFFVGIGLNLAMAFIPVPDQETAMLLLLPQAAAGALIMAGTPVACGHASAASDETRIITGKRIKNPAWGFYGGGWALYGIGTVITFAGMMGGNLDASLIGGGTSMAGMALWGVASVKAVRFIGNQQEIVESGEWDRLSLSITPRIGLDGSVGLALNGLF